MSASTNRSIKSSGNTGTSIVKFLSTSPVINNDFAVTNIFSFKSIQIGTQQVGTTIYLRAGDDTTTINRFRLEIYHEGSGYTSTDFIVAPSLMPLYVNGDNTTEWRFSTFDLTNVLNDDTDAFEVNIYVDYTGNTEALSVGGTFAQTKLV
jgi:hypothetical protein